MNTYTVEVKRGPEVRLSLSVMAPDSLTAAEQHECLCADGEYVKVVPNRISGGAASGTPTCPTCPHLLADKKYPGWGWCNHPENRVHGKGWVNGFTPSQSPSGSCELHPERAAITKATP